MPGTSARPIRLAIVNDYEIVVAGVRAMLEGRSEVSVVELDDRAVDSGSVDIVLYDNFAQRWHDNDHLEDLVRRSSAKVVVFTWTFDEASMRDAFAAGAWGYLSKGLGADEVVAALRLVHDGQQGDPPRRGPDRGPRPRATGPVSASASPRASPRSWRSSPRG